jgi:hypothetical protein
LEEKFPVGGNLTLSRKQIPVRLYAFKPDRADEYRLRSYGVIFSVNGQMHAAFPTDVFRRKAVNLSYLADSLLVVLDCSGVDEIMREDLFMNSRDRLRGTPLARRLEEELERYLKEEPVLRALQNRRREERAADRLKDDKPLAEVLQGLLKKNPLLSKLFSHGLRLSAPFPPSGGAGGGGTSNFVGKQFPTYFRFKGRQSGEVLKREARLGSRVRVPFETDAVDDYFIRDNSPGAWRVLVEEAGAFIDAPDWTSTGPSDGIAQLWINSLPEATSVGSLVRYRVDITDDSRVDAIENEFVLEIQPEATGGAGGGGKSKSSNTGSGKTGSTPLLAMPPIIPVSRDEWQTNKFDELTAVKIERADGGGEVDLYDFYVNIDNRYLKIVQKETKADPQVIEKQFIYGMVLVGLALLQEHKARAKGSPDNANGIAQIGPEDLVASATRAMAPIFLPMVDAIGSLTADEE